jgi:hypothetical protein
MEKKCLQLSIPFFDCELRNALVSLCNNLVVMYIILGQTKS